MDFTKSILSQKKENSRPFGQLNSLCWRLPIFPGGCPPSIFGTNELNYRVRDGNGWTLIVISTNSETERRFVNCSVIIPQENTIVNPFLKIFLIFRKLFYIAVFIDIFCVICYYNKNCHRVVNARHSLALR